jgi:phospholipase C
MDRIEHVVLLMLENRSFDSQLGWLYENSQPAHHIPPLKDGERAFDGLQGLDLRQYPNADSTGNITYFPTRGAQGLNMPNVAPGETYADVTTQLFGTENPPANATPTMLGYVRDYCRVLRKEGLSEDDVKRCAVQVMQSFTPTQLPVLNGLAAHYAVCDRWFSSVPSQTNPNRAFAFTGTSMGLTDNGFREVDPRAKPIEELVGYRLGDDRFPTLTIFNALYEGGVDSWRIFRESGMLQSNVAAAAEFLKPFLPGESYQYLMELSSNAIVSDYTRRLFPRLQNIPNLDAHFTPQANLTEFHDAARGGRLPAFTFIQPEWTIGERGTGGGVKSVLFHQGDDYHPPVNLDSGEQLLTDVYLSLIANKQAWEKTLLVITFDEPVGSFDHVPPPAAAPPWGSGQTPDFPLENGFRFDRLGGRVPTILVSPLIEKGTVFRSTTDTPFDHTSIITTLLKWRGLQNRVPEFGARTAQAPTFDGVVTRSTPRTDERDIGFLQVARKRGQPVRYFDKFLLRNPMGKYISMFREFSVPPFSVFGNDPSASQYFPTLAYVDRYRTGLSTRFYLQNARDRPDPSPIQISASGTSVRLVASQRGLGSYNVLGGWRDSTDCYYFNDYTDGDDSAKQTWILRKPDGSAGPLLFGDKVYIDNTYWSGQHLASHGDFVTTARSGTEFWTVEPISDEAPGPSTINVGRAYYLKHVLTGRYLNGVYKSDQWYPTLGNGDKVRITVSGYVDSPIYVDGMECKLVSANEDLNSGGKRCDMLMAWSNAYLYYYYQNYSQDYQTWIISREEGSGLVKTGDQVRLINKGYGQFMISKWYDSTLYLSTSGDYSAECDWVLEQP